jgi:peptidoglycan/xylan/chitin deacetylase (PgdA/CDA1 family)
LSAAPAPASGAPPRPPITVSVDVDPVDLHLVGYGYRGLPPDPLAYTTAIPRLLEIFARTGVRGTFFVVGRDAAAHADAVTAIASAGHEVASHSQTHPMAFGRLPDARMRAELADSKAALEAAGGGSVIGFRAPNFDVSPRVVGALVETGYRYDASAYPTPLLFPVRALLALKSRDPRAVFTLRAWPFTFERAPFDWRAGAQVIREYPTTVTPFLRLPFYHTMRYYLPDWRFVARLGWLARHGEALSYPLHAVDALGLVEDRVDPRLRRHPGMNWPLGRKLDMLEMTLGAIAARFEPMPFRDRLLRDAAGP